MHRVFFVWNGGRFSATLVAPWFLNKTYKLDPLWIQFFVLYKIDDWAQIDSSTPSASKMAFIGPRLKVKMVPKLQLSNFQKMEREILTLVVWKVPRLFPDFTPLWSIIISFDKSLKFECHLNSTALAIYRMDCQSRKYLHIFDGKKY